MRGIGEEEVLELVSLAPEAITELIEPAMMIELVGFPVGRGAAPRG